MHNVNDTTELVIRKLTEGYITLTQEDKEKIRSYIFSNQDKIPVISNLGNYYMNSHLGAMYSFLYKNSGIIGILEVISDEDKCKNIREKADKYIYTYRGWYKEFLIENFQEFLAFNAFIYDKSECQYGKESWTNYKEMARDWAVLHNNCQFIKALVVNGTLSFKTFYNFQGSHNPYSEDNDEETLLVDYKLKKIEEKIKNYVKEKTGVALITSNIINFSEESCGFNENEPATLMKLTAIALINNSSILRQY